MKTDITLPELEIAAFCKKYAIQRLSLFGSVLRADFTPDSDVDVLVEFLPNSRITYLDMAGMQIELSAILGQKVDLLTPSALSEHFQQAVLTTAKTMYSSL